MPSGNKDIDEANAKQYVEHEARALGRAVLGCLIICAVIAACLVGVFGVSLSDLLSSAPLPQDLQKTGMSPEDFNNLVATAKVLIGTLASGGLLGALV